MSTLHDLVHHGIKNPKAWPVIGDAFEEHGDPDTAEIFRSKRVLPRDPSYWMDNEDNYEVVEHLGGPYHLGYSVVGRGDTEPISSHWSHQAATEAIQDRVADKNSTVQEVIDHVRGNGREIAPGVHLVNDGKLTHLHDFRHIDSGDEYDPDTLRPVATFQKEKRVALARPLPEYRRGDSSRFAKITGLTAGGDCEHCGKKDVALIHVKGNDSGKEIKLGSTCAGKLCHTTTGEKLHRAKLVRHGHAVNTLRQMGHEPIYPTIMYDSDKLQLSRWTEEARQHSDGATVYDIKHPKGGYVSITHLPKDATVAVNMIEVPPKLRNQGIGRELIDRVKAKARELGAKRIATVKILPGAEGFAGKMGFNVDDKMPHIKLARHITDIAHSFNPEKSPTAYADALAEVGHPLALFVRRAKVGVPLIKTSAGHEWTSLPGQRGRKELHVPRVRALEAPDLGIHRVGFHYDPEAGAGHIVVTMKTTDPVSARETTWHAPATKQELKDLGLRNRRMKLARPDVVADGVSRQQGVRRKLAAKIAVQAGLRLQTLLDARTETQAGVLQTYGHENEPDAIDYAAAWYGLLSRSPRLTSFHVHDGGPDTYHTWKTSADPDTVLRTAKGLGLNAVVTSAGNVAVLDAGNQAAAPISALKEATYARAPLSEPGTAKAFGSRDDYRNAIRAYERSVLGNRPSAPPAAGQPAA